MAKRVQDSEGFCLVVDGERDSWAIGWEDPEFGQINLWVGEDRQPKDPPTDPNQWLSWIADKCCRESGAEFDHHRYVWETRQQAQSALAAIALAVASGKPWPDWAIKAKEAHWTPPKGWRP